MTKVSYNQPNVHPCFEGYFLLSDPERTFSFDILYLILLENIVIDEVQLRTAIYYQQFLSHFGAHVENNV